ncbi:hypothetical protein QBC41DRAFT_17140 [Cercophora samala]|uniref:Cupin type-2 domain-containing protein n=1 Tax=Cercophora samala TaxID=330535 RepID=A0AA40D6H8_9PEZI|nr:hypothetical protein QBC41DRAFT_17140 [Cercophora samala]
MYIPGPSELFHTMASLIPIIQEVLPIVMPASISVTRSADILPPSEHTSSGDQPDDRTDVSPKTVIPAAAPTPAPTPAPAAGPAGGARVISRDAIVGQAESMCATVLIIKPRSSSLIHHNGEQETILYVTSGTGGVLLSQPKDEDERHPERHVLGRGDFAYIPAWLEHQAVNESEFEDLMLVVIRSGSAPVEVNLKTWGGAEMKKARS